MSIFESLNLSAPLLKTLNKLGYNTPTPIQAKCIPVVLKGLDLLGSAQTGTGKTAAFALPLIERLLQGARPLGKKSAARAIILAPTRELAGQILESLRTYSQGTDLCHTAIYGGVSQNRQVRQLKSGVDVIVATPGRLEDLMQQGYVDLSRIEMFVLDEADRMLDMGFIEPIRRIGRALPSPHQTLFFSATMPPKIRQLAEAILREPRIISVSPVASASPLIDQMLFHVAGENKLTLLSHLLEDINVLRSVVFTRTKHGADRLVRNLTRDGVTAAAIHGNKSQNQRQRALDAFRKGRSRVLVATDVAARGLDVDGITHVFNYDIPNEAEAYVHRIGRTGRAGAVGQAISFCSRDEVSDLRAIERLTGESIEVSVVPAELGLPEEKLPESNRRETGKKNRKPARKDSSSPRSANPRKESKPRRKAARPPAKQNKRPVPVGRKRSKKDLVQSEGALSPEIATPKPSPAKKAKKQVSERVQGGKKLAASKRRSSSTNAAASKQNVPAKHGASSKPKRGQRRKVVAGDALGKQGRKAGTRRRVKQTTKAVAAQ